MEKYLSALKAIHSSSGVCESPVELTSPFKELYENAGGEQDVYSNYGDKLASRVKNNPDLYNSLGPEASHLFKKLQVKLDQYKSQKLASPVKVIHGDPVFSNGILTPSGDVVFLDMRGQLGHTYTLYGDCMYDLAKVYQTLFGYDLVLNMKEETLLKCTLSDIITPTDARILAELRSAFIEFVKTHYKVEMEYLKVLTSSLYFSLLPYHSSIRWTLFFDLAKQVFEA